MTAFWYVVETKPSHEKLVARGLDEQAFENFLPVYSREVAHARSVIVRSLPLFPSYLFVRFDIRSRWQPIIGTRGVVCLLGSPTAISDRAVNEIRGITSESGFTPGQRVRIRSGVWKDIEGLFSFREKDRIAVLFTLLGRDVTKTFHHTQVAAAVR